MDFASFVLAASTADLDDEPAARTAADAIEFRMDLATDPLDAVEAYDGELPLIVTNRLAAEGGRAPADGARLDALERAATHPDVEAVDVELGAVLEGDADRVLDRARDAGAAVIVSSHDFETTPDLDEMRAVLERSGRLGDVAKLAVTATDRRDVLDLLAVTDELSTGGATVATMAMGEAGRHSRALAPVYGSVVGYAPVEPAEATAPGQYDLGTLRTLVDLLG